MFTLFGAVITYPVVLVFSFPALYVMRRMQWLSVWSFLMLGVFLALFCWVLMFWPFQSVSSEQHVVSYGFFGLVSGLCGSFVFWFLGVKGNSTLTHHSSGTPKGAP